MLEQQLFNKLKPFLVCPKCKGELKFTSKLIKCVCCETVFPQLSHEWLNFMPEHQSETGHEDSQWKQRLSEMEGWYSDLIAQPVAASRCFTSDYTPYATFLSSLSGNILDLGGGIGIPRHYLSPNSNYIVVDPSLAWIRSDWLLLVERFPCLRDRLDFVLGVGEYLPFNFQSFDTVLSFWSLNHARDPKLVFSEVDRVLKPGGCFFIVLEEMTPHWFDLLDPKFPAQLVFNCFFNPKFARNRINRLRLFLKLILIKEWPLQVDHIRIKETEIRSWIAKSFFIKRRFWVNQYLTYELLKK